MKPIQADLFCRVIDNLGDIGIMWRLARQLAHEKHWDIRLWVDDLVAFQRLLPAIHPNQTSQHHAGVSVHHWSEPWPTDIEPQAVAIAGFSCDLPEPLLAKMAQQKGTTWLQLDYLSAEAWVSDFHGRPSPRTDGLSPVFFFPGFEATTGGLLREDGLIARRRQWQQDHTATRQWLQSLGVTGLESTATAPNNPRLISLFCYPEASLEGLQQALLQASQHTPNTPNTWNAPIKVLVPESLELPPWCDQRDQRDQPTEAQVSWHRIPFLSQPDYDKLLWSMDLNFVRGEDSFVRAIWAGRPLIWQPYPQSEHMHLNKLNAWLAKTDLPTEVQASMQHWADGSTGSTGNASNTSNPAGEFATALSKALTPATWAAWQAASERHSTHLTAQPDLAHQIDQWCRDRHTPEQDR